MFLPTFLFLFYIALIYSGIKQVLKDRDFAIYGATLLEMWEGLRREDKATIIFVSMLTFALLFRLWLYTRTITLEHQIAYVVGLPLYAMAFISCQLLPWVLHLFN